MHSARLLRIFAAPCLQSASRERRSRPVLSSLGRARGRLRQPRHERAHLNNGHNVRMDFTIEGTDATPRIYVRAMRTGIFRTSRADVSAARPVRSRRPNMSTTRVGLTSCFPRMGCARCRGVIRRQPYTVPCGISGVREAAVWGSREVWQYLMRRGQSSGQGIRVRRSLNTVIARASTPTGRRIEIKKASNEVHALQQGGGRGAGR